MHTRDIPIDEWQPFLEGFTRLHQGERMGIEIVGLGGGPGSDLSHRPLLAVAALPDSQGTCIEVIAGTQAEPQTRTIQHPSHLTVTEREDGFRWSCKSPMTLALSRSSAWSPRLIPISHPETISADHPRIAHYSELFACTIYRPAI